MKLGSGIFLTVVALALIVSGAYYGLVGIPYKDDIFAAGTKLVGALFVVTVFIERSTAVLNSIWYGEAQRQAEANWMLVQLHFEKTLKPDDELPKSLVDATSSLAMVDAKQDRLRMIAGFFIALFVSAAGMRTLESLQTLPQTLSAFQLGLFHAIDMLITAGLIAGGSDGIHAIADLLKKYVQVTKLKLMRASVGP